MIGALKRNFSKDVKQTFFVNLSRLLTGPITMILIPLYLTKQMQGYWYSFMSISALSILADLGFTVIVLQFSAHEFAHLSFTGDNRFEGPKIYLDRLISFFRFIAKWGSYTVGFAFPVIFFVGYYIFSAEKNQFSWVLPWIIFIAGSGVKFYLNIVISFFEGCGMIAKVQKIRNINVLLNFFLVVPLLVVHGQLYAIAMSSIVSSLVMLWQVVKAFGAPIVQLRKEEIEDYNWRPEVMGLMWRYMISWFSGYLIFQLFTPIAFKYYGSAFAGQVGITITLINAIFSMANIWIYVITPKLNMLVSQRQWDELDKVFKSSLVKSILTYIGCGVLCLVFFYVAGIYYHKFTDRFLSFTNLALLLAAWLAQLIINALAIYNRANKEEPYVVPSLVKGVYVSGGTLLIALLLPKQYLMFGFYSSFLFSIPWFVTIFKAKRKQMRATPAMVQV